ncbi:glycosyltransferase family 4 protein [Acinetobacter sp.]|uniref:glycosyltransferase family 4 protein n=1 Tax=Acinetobacter sp. TaxID=472 RepID=UPI003D07B24E
MNLIVWMNQPSHHQAQFFDELNSKCERFQVFYYDKIPSARSEMGWDKDFQLESYEKYIDPKEFKINLDELKNYIHILPGYGHPLLLKLRNEFSKNGIKWIHWSENATPGWKWYLSSYRKFIHAHYINNFALGALAIGEHAKNDFIKWGVKSKKIEILPYSFNSLISKDPDAEIVKFKAGRKAFLCIGVLYPRKGIDLLIKAFAQSYKDHPEWCLVLIGNEKEGYNYRKLVSDLGIESQVLFRGVIPAQNISSAYYACEIFVLPSRYDGWGMVVNEAIYCGLPVIVSDAVGASPHLVTPKNGFVFHSNSLLDLVACMEKYQDETVLESHASNSKKVFELFRSDVFSEKLLRIIKRWNNQ